MTTVRITVTSPLGDVEVEQSRSDRFASVGDQARATIAILLRTAELRVRAAYAIERSEDKAEAKLARVQELVDDPDTGDMYSDSAIVVDATALSRILEGGE